MWHAIYVMATCQPPLADAGARGVGVCGGVGVGVGGVASSDCRTGRGMGPGLVPYVPIPFLNPPPVH